MGVQDQNGSALRQRPKFKLGRAARAVTHCTVALALMLFVSAGSAWSLDRLDSATGFDVSGDAPGTSQLPSPSMDDSCLPLLKSVHHTSPQSAMDRTQRTAGTAAALGVVFGVRFALGPKETAKSGRNNARLTIWQPTSGLAGDRHALAVADYRECRKEQALKALSDFRWTR